MPDHVDVPEEAVEAVAEALWNEREFKDPSGPPPWNWCPPGEDVHQKPPNTPALWDDVVAAEEWPASVEETRTEARLALRVASPIIAAKDDEIERAREERDANLIDALANLDLLELNRQAVKSRDEEIERLRKELEELEDRFESCDNCERPSREEDLKVIWCQDAESGEPVDARICAVCRAEQALPAELEKLAEEFEEGGGAERDNDEPGVPSSVYYHAASRLRSRATTAWRSSSAPR